MLLSPSSNQGILPSPYTGPFTSLFIIIVKFWFCLSIFFTNMWRIITIIDFPFKFIQFLSSSFSVSANSFLYCLAFFLQNACVNSLILTLHISQPTFPQVQQPLKTDELPACLPSKDPPPQCHPWEIYIDLKRCLFWRRVVQTTSRNSFWKNLLMSLAHLSQKSSTPLFNKVRFLLSGSKQMSSRFQKRHPFRRQIKTSVTHFKFS